MDNKRLGVVLESHALIAQMAFDGKWRSCASKNIHLVTTLALLKLLLEDSFLSSKSLFPSLMTISLLSSDTCFFKVIFFVWIKMV